MVSHDSHMRNVPIFLDLQWINTSHRMHESQWADCGKAIIYEHGTSHTKIKSVYQFMSKTASHWCRVKTSDKTRFIREPLNQHTYSQHLHGFTFNSKTCFHASSLSIWCKKYRILEGGLVQLMSMMPGTTLCVSSSVCIVCEVPALGETRHHSLTSLLTSRRLSLSLLQPYWD